MISIPTRLAQGCNRSLTIFEGSLQTWTSINERICFTSCLALLQPHHLRTTETSGKQLIESYSVSQCFWLCGFKETRVWSPITPFPLPHLEHCRPCISTGQCFTPLEGFVVKQSAKKGLSCNIPLLIHDVSFGIKPPPFVCRYSLSVVIIITPQVCTRSH